MQSYNCDVIIAGAGPAGLAAALTFSALGISYCLIDANKSVNYKAGDALPPNSKPLLKQLGLLDLLQDEAHIPYYGNQSIWGSNQIHKEEFISNLHGHGYLIDRMKFENQLRSLIRKKQDSFFEGFKIKQIECDKNVALEVQSHSEKINITASYLIDATGRKASVFRQLGIQKKEFDQQMAISFWHQLKTPIPRQIWIEATKNGWWYLSPTSTSKVNCMFFTLKEIIPSKKDLAHFLAKEIDQTVQFKNLIKPSIQELKSHKIMPCGSSYLEKPYYKKCLAIGDAAFSFDPISSYGITSAMATGFYGAQAVASHLANEKEAFMAYHYIIENSSKVYLKNLAHQYQAEQRWSSSYFWKNRLKHI